MTHPIWSRRLTEPSQGCPLLEALLKKSRSCFFGDGTVDKACCEDFTQRLTRLQRDQDLVLLTAEAFVVHGEILPMYREPD